MEWLEALRGTVVALDTAPLIYFIEEHPIYLEVVRPFFETLQRREFTVMTSTLTLAEVLVHPIRNHDDDLATRYGDILQHSPLRMVSMTQDIAVLVARIRAEHGIRTPDAIQLATAQHAGATSILTNDTRFPSVGGMRVLVLDRLREHA